MRYVGSGSLGRAPLDSHCFVGVALERSLIGQPKPVNRTYKGSGQIENAFVFDYYVLTELFLLFGRWSVAKKCMILKMNERSEVSASRFTS